MKILMVNKFLYPNGGSETYIFKIGEELQRTGHEVQYFGMEHQGRIVGNRINVYTDDMDFHTGKLKKLMYPFKIIYSKEAYKKITMVLKDFEPDVVHLNNFNFQLTPSIIYAVRKWEKSCGKPVKLVFTAHDYQWVCPNHLMQRFDTKKTCFECSGGRYGCCVKHKCIHGSTIKSLLGAIEGYFYRKRHTYELVDNIICPSEFIKTKIDTYEGLASRTRTLRNFIDIGDNSAKDIAKGENLKQDYVLYFGRYSQEKGVETLLKVCSELKDIPFVFAGGGPLNDEVNKVSNIENKGFLKGQELIDVVTKARFAIFSSEWYENCPFSVMEAISYGTPVVGADIGGVPELIQDGVNGLLFEAGNKNQLKQMISKLYFDKEKLDELTKGAKDTEFMSLQEYCAELLDIYRNKPEIG